MTARDGATRTSILKAAAELFGERGFKGSTTKAIAERAGVNEVTIFRHFGSKQGILPALGEMWAKSMAGFAVTDIPDPSDLRGTLETLARMEVRQATEFGAAAMRLAFDAHGDPEVAEILGEGPRDNLEGLTAYLRDRQEAGVVRGDIDARVIAEGFFLLTSTLVMSRRLLSAPHTADTLPAEEAVRQLVTVYVDDITRGDE